MRLYKIILLLLLSFSTNYTLALSTDSSQAILIEADMASMDNIKRVAVYEGNVIIMQGSIRINAVKITLNYTKEQNLDKIIATGKPVYFSQQLDNKEIVKAQAYKMEFHAAKNTIYLTKNAELYKEKDGKNIYSSKAPRIIYDTASAIIKADKGRVFIKIHPQTKKK
ncbi:MAG: lipopolysaccharide transport periplasmic protein LptA [Thiomargarita sp.]|nr:lipopolysaccharide transport periplasmic protein LptA [Thiomargarita sp.]